MSITSLSRPLIVASLLLLSACGHHANVDKAKLAAIPDRMREFVAKNEISGAVTLASRDLFTDTQAVGLADVERNQPMRKDTIFWIASMTKPITATAVMMMRDEGKLSIEDPVSKFIPEFARLKTSDGQSATVTIRHLLTHTSGLAEATADEERGARTLADLIPYYVNRPLAFAPGTRWQYCQSGINTAARIVEIVSGQFFSDFLEKRLFGPLGMKDTAFYLTREQQARMATSYRSINGKLESVSVYRLHGYEPTFRDRYPAANGGLYSTAPDYARFCRMILGDGKLDGRQYLTPESVKMMTTVQTGDLRTGFTEGNGWGLGWCIVRTPQGVTAMLSPGTFGHGGAYGTQAWVDPGRSIIYILMVQRANFPNADNSDVRRVFQETASPAFPR